MSSSTKLEPGPIRHGLTMVEILVSIAIAVILAGIVVISGQTARRSRMHASAEQQMALIATAISQYADFWPRWEAVDPASGGPVVVADKGWPDFIPGRLFAPPVFQTIAGINDKLTFDPNGIVYSAQRESFEDPTNWQYPGDVLNANTCLAYSLTAPIGKGPFVSDKAGSSVLIDIAEIHKQPSPATYPPYTAVAAVNRRQVFVDPWGTPYRYFWACRDRTPPSGPRAYKGYLAVPTADVTSTSFAKADTFVLESAGPNKKFGNVWKSNPTPQELEDASDNLIIMP
ncbi:MAG TPA: type II secretion system protein [Phycisphaerae bacterium]|nr:type II secretion system protein [Phycisphaerae bacterium]